MTAIFMVIVWVGNAAASLAFLVMSVKTESPVQINVAFKGIAKTGLAIAIQGLKAQIAAIEVAQMDAQITAHV